MMGCGKGGFCERGKMWFEKRILWNGRGSSMIVNGTQTLKLSNVLKPINIWCVYEWLFAIMECVKGWIVKKLDLGEWWTRRLLLTTRGERFPRLLKLTITSNIWWAAKPTHSFSFLWKEIHPGNGWGSWMACKHNHHISNVCLNDRVSHISNSHLVG